MKGEGGGSVAQCSPWLMAKIDNVLERGPVGNFATHFPGVLLGRKTRGTEQPQF